MGRTGIEFIRSPAHWIPRHDRRGWFLNVFDQFTDTVGMAVCACVLWCFDNRHELHLHDTQVCIIFKACTRTRLNERTQYADIICSLASRNTFKKARCMVRLTCGQLHTIWQQYVPVDPDKIGEILRNK